MLYSDNEIGVVNGELQSALAEVANRDFSWAYKVLESLVENKSKDRSRFSENQNKYITDLGFEVPNGYHFHFTDEDGHEYPPEILDRDAKLAARGIISIAHGKHTFATCYICGPVGCIG